jgi:hypothetical protein
LGLQKALLDLIGRQQMLEALRENTKMLTVQQTESEKRTQTLIMTLVQKLTEAADRQSSLDTKALQWVLQHDDYMARLNMEQAADFNSLAQTMNADILDYSLQFGAQVNALPQQLLGIMQLMSVLNAEIVNGYIQAGIINFHDANQAISGLAQVALEQNGAELAEYINGAVALSQVSAQSNERVAMGGLLTAGYLSNAAFQMSQGVATGAFNSVNHMSNKDKGLELAGLATLVEVNRQNIEARNPKEPDQETEEEPTL